MNVLIRSSKIVELESDGNPFAHNLDQFENLAIENKHRAINDSQYNKNVAQQEVQPEKIKTALKNTNETTFKPEIIASTKKIEPISSKDVKLDMLNENDM